MIVCDIFWRLQHSAARQLMHFIHPPRMTLAYMVTNKKRKENGALSAYLAQDRHHQHLWSWCGDWHRHGTGSH